MSQAEEEVDQFGRTITRRFDRTDSRIRDDDRPLDRAPRERTRSPGPGRYDHGRFDDGPRGGRRDAYGDNMYYEHHNNDYRNRSYPSEDFSRYNRQYEDYYPSGHTDTSIPQGNPNAYPPAPPRAVSANPVNPLMSFKSFVQMQAEDLPVEEFQRRYEQYNLDYMVYFSDAFFKASKAEEWFQDRYNPINILNTERDAAESARIEAACIKQTLQSHPEEFVAACSLEPSARKNRKSVSALPKAITDTTAAPTADGNTVVSGGEKPMEEIAGRHLSGHEQRTVYLSGVHACCPKHVLTGAILAHLQARSEGLALTMEEMTPVRILISQPMWSNRVLDKFERSAWVVFATAEAAKCAIELLHDLDIAVPLKGGPADANFTFKIQAALHLVSRSSNNNTVLPDYLCYSVRMKADIQRAALLAKLLDEERNIPEDCRLSALLQEEQAQQHIKRMHEHLDVMIAYLRRVHYVAFYGARRFRDEAHLLLMSPCISFRPKAFIQCGEDGNNAQDGGNYSLLGVTANTNVRVSASELLPGNEQQQLPTSAEEEAAVAAAEAESEAATNNSSSNAEVETKAESETVANDDAMAVEEDQPLTNASTTTAIATTAAASIGNNNSKSNVGVRIFGRFIVTADRKIDAMINDLKQRIRLRRIAAEAAAEAAAASATTAEVGGDDNNNNTARNNHNIAKAIVTGLQDEDDAKKLEALQEISFEKFVHEHIKVEPNEKCRCMYNDCNKLFQNNVFVVKHFRLRHPGCGDHVLLADAESFMRRRFEDEELMARPLPPIEVDINHRLELKTVREIMEKFQKAKAAGVFFNMNSNTASSSNQQHNRNNSHNNNDRYRNNNNSNNNNNGRNGGRDRDYHNNDRPRNSYGANYRQNSYNNNHNNSGNKRNRDSFENSADKDEKMKFSVSNHSSADNAHANTTGAQAAAAAPATTAGVRKYMDIDAPKDVTIGASAINYGSIIPGMAKRRKLSGKVLDPLIASPPPATSAPATTKEE